MPRTQPRSIRKRRSEKFAKQNGKCHWCKKEMTLERGNGRGLPKNYATFEHLQRKRDGGAGKPNNVVLACYICNINRERSQPGHHNSPKPENLSARTATQETLKAKLSAGTLTEQERGELYKRGILPNWPMWSKMMASVPLGNP